jgi:glycosyltransferase involved in cell wall biosynthesis
MLSIVIATHNRTELLKECLETISRQQFTDFEVIIAHSGMDDGTEKLITAYPERYLYVRCKNKGAAVQRNEGVAKAKGKWIVFLDDDVLLESQFLFEINQSILRNPLAKGVCGSITNQYYSEPSSIFRFLLKMFGITDHTRLDGKVLGPALNFLPKKEGHDEEPIQWMPTCVCAYDRELYLKLGGFPSQFVGYSYGEDLFLSLLIHQDHLLILNRNARLYHKDIGSTSHKNHYKIALMQVNNRNYINKVILKKNKFIFNMQLVSWNLASVFATVIRGNLKPTTFFNTSLGYIIGCIRNSY